MTKEDMFWKELKDDWTGRQYISKAEKFFQLNTRRLKIPEGGWHLIVESDRYFLEIIKKEKNDLFQCRSSIITKDDEEIPCTECFFFKIDHFKRLVEESTLKRINKR